MRKSLRVNWMSLLLASQKLKTLVSFSAKECIDDSDNKEITDHYKEQGKFKEAKRQNYRPEAALWLSLASYISSSNVQDKKIRTLANLLGAI